MHRYIDYVLSWGPAIAGHAVDEVNDALKAQIDKGTSFGAPCELEVAHLCKSLQSGRNSLYHKQSIFKGKARDVKVCLAQRLLRFPG